MIPGVLIDRMTVYGPGSGGGFTEVLAEDIPCRIVRVRGTAPTLQERAELGRLRRLLFDAGYVLPTRCVVQVGADLWNVVPGSDAAPRGPSGAIHHKSADITKSSAGGPA